MRDALNATGRPIFFSLCGMHIYHECFSMCYLIIFSMKGGVDKNDQWPPSVGNSWRTTDDIQDNWDSMFRNINLVRLCW